MVTEITCNHCHVVIPESETVRHSRSSCRLIWCDLCHQPLLRKELENHKREDCSDRTVACTLCGCVVRFRDLVEHSRRECPKGARACQACGEVFTFEEIGSHVTGQVCPAESIPCEACGVRLRRAEMDGHKQYLCIAAPAKWTCGCGSEVPSAQRVDHLKLCSRYLDAWESALEKLLCVGSNANLRRRVAKLSQRLNVGEKLCLLALAESEGQWQLAEQKVTSDAEYIVELRHAASAVNMRPFLKSLSSNEKRVTSVQDQGAQPQICKRE